MRHAPLIIANWKLNGSRQTIKRLFDNLRKKFNKILNCNIVIAPPEVYLNMIKYAINDYDNVFLGAQNTGIHLSGAFTGETSAKMLKDIGVKYVIIGHSERRILHKESDELIAKKFAIIKKQNLIPVLCIGESETENKTGRTKEICLRQINSIINNHGIAAFNDAVIAYEPIWSIGTGKSADPIKVQIILKFIRNYIADIDAKVAEQIIFQYGGSVNSNNAEELLNQPDIDGILVGSASLKEDVFFAIIKIAENVY